MNTCEYNVNIIFFRSALLCQVPPQEASDPKTWPLCGARISQQQPRGLHHHL